MQMSREILKISPRVERCGHEGWRHRRRIEAGKPSSRFVRINYDETGQRRSERHPKIIKRKSRKKKMRVLDNATRVFAESLPLSEAIEGPEVQTSVLGWV